MNVNNLIYRAFFDTLSFRHSATFSYFPKEECAALHTIYCIAASVFGQNCHGFFLGLRKCDIVDSRRKGLTSSKSNTKLSSRFSY